MRRKPLSFKHGVSLTSHINRLSNVNLFLDRIDTSATQAETRAMSGGTCLAMGVFFWESFGSEGAEEIFSYSGGAHRSEFWGGQATQVVPMNQESPGF